MLSGELGKSLFASAVLTGLFGLCIPGLAQLVTEYFQFPNEGECSKRNATIILPLLPTFTVYAKVKTHRLSMW